MMMQRRAAMLGGILAIFGFVISSGLAGAAASVGGANGMRVSPVTTNLTINPGESAVVTVNVQNVTKASADFQVVINDFTAKDETGSPALLLNPGQFAPTHSLKRYVAPISNISLNAGEQKAIQVSISIPKGTSGGGYYGAVRFAPASINPANNVTLSSSVASLILVRVPGNFKEQLNLASFDVYDGEKGSPKLIFTSNQDIIAVVRFQNAGDIQEQPFGKVLVSSGSQTLSTLELNDKTRGNVLPDSIRRFNVKLDKVGVFGKYTVIGNFGYGTSGQLVSGQTTFYVIPLGAILGALAVILVTLFLIFGFPRLKRMYDNSVMQRSRRR